MHPEIVSSKPGTCPKCHMDLVLSKDKDASLSTWKDYAPLIVIISVILLTTITLAVRDLGLGMFSLENTLSYFMIGFFLIFATFKLMDLKGFAHGYQTYDILAQKIPLYGHVYPFIELFFGLAMIVIPLSTSLLITEFVVMMFSGLGVAIKIAKKEEFMCVCLGTFLKIPLTKVTLIENFGMAALAIAMLLLQAL